MTHLTIRLAPKDRPLATDQEFKIPVQDYAEAHARAAGFLWAAHQRGAYCAVLFPRGLQWFTTSPMSGAPPVGSAPYIAEALARMRQPMQLDEIVSAGLAHVRDTLVIEFGYLDPAAFAEAVATAARAWAEEVCGEEWGDDS